MKIFYKGKKTKSKYKNSEVKSYMAKPMQIIAIYTFDSAVPCTPVFSNVNSRNRNINSYIETDVDNGDGTTTRTIRSFDLPTKIDFRDLGSLISVEYLNTSNVTDMSFMFYNCTNLTSIDTSKWNTSNVTNMQNMFDLCSSLASLDLSNWNVSKVQNMSAMFGTCSSLKKLNVSNWKTNSLTKADWMFNKCLNLQYLDLSSWNVNNVNDMSYALSDCESLEQLDLSNWNLNNADITGIFSASSYSGCFNLNTILINNSDYNSVNKIITNLPTRKDSSHGKISIGETDSSSVDTATANNKYWDVAKYLVAVYTFNSSTNTLPTFNSGYTYNYTDVDNGNGTTTRTITSDTLPSKISFNNKMGLVNLSYLNTSNVTNMGSMFSNCKNLTSLDLNSFNTSKVTGMSYMFANCPKLTSINLSNWDTSNVTNMYSMFFDCPKLTTIKGLSSFNTNKVTNMSEMFDGCKALTSLDLSSFNTNKVTNMSYMFYSCTNLISLDLSNFNTSKVTVMSGMFSSCNKLNLIDMDNSNVDSINDIIKYLPTRTSSNYGTVIAPSLDDSINKTTANSKYWNIIN